MYVEIGGIEQWLQMNAGGPDRPVLLYLHGGPGGSSRSAAAAWAPWEDHFTVVHWDQRGAGRTFGRNGEAGCGPLTIDRMVSDGIEVAEYLVAQLGQPKILLVGHSWGSVLAVHMIKRRPELFSAYVGAGQLVNLQQNEVHNYRRQMAQAERQQNQEALQALREIGPPPFSDRSKLTVLRAWADRLAEGDGDAVQPRPSPMPSDLTADDITAMMQGFEFSRTQLFGELGLVDLPALGLAFDLPMFFFHGTEDQQTPIEPAEAYFDSITAPHKAFVCFEGCHHFVVMNRPDDFLRELLTRVRPLL